MQAAVVVDDQIKWLLLSQYSEHWQDLDKIVINVKSDYKQIRFDEHSRWEKIRFDGSTFSKLDSYPIGSSVVFFLK